jgi:hypothetical protein
MYTINPGWRSSDPGQRRVVLVEGEAGEMIHT